jgi:hypothetical protein
VSACLTIAIDCARVLGNFSLTLPKNKWQFYFLKLVLDNKKIFIFFEGASSSLFIT